MGPPIAIIIPVFLIFARYTNEWIGVSLVDTRLGLILLYTVFALPFALTGALLATREHSITWTQVGWIVLAMVSARSAAMGFNRLADARFDALNPRTA